MPKHDKSLLTTFILAGIPVVLAAVYISTNLPDKWANLVLTLAAVTAIGAMCHRTDITRRDEHRQKMAALESIRTAQMTELSHQIQQQLSRVDIHRAH